LFYFIFTGKQQSQEHCVLIVYQVLSQSFGSLCAKPFLINRLWTCSHPWDSIKCSRMVHNTSWIPAQNLFVC